MKTACQHHDAIQVKNYLEAWGKIHWPEYAVMNLGLIAKKINDEPFKTEITNLSAFLYSTKKIQWDGEKLWEAFQAYTMKKPMKNKEKSPDLPPLFYSEQFK